MKRTKHIKVISAAVLVLALANSCGVKREPGSVYMPDMAYSRAYETNALRDSAIFTTERIHAGAKIYYNGAPAMGTMERGQDVPPYTLPNDSNGYKMSAQVVNPLGVLSAADSAESGRLYNINCGVCHGAKGQANGPIAERIGAVANLTTEQYIKMADGTMFHSIQYGKNNMGSYASQLSRKQRWQIVQYIRLLQPKPKTAETAGAKTVTVATVAAADSATKKGK
jgi:mono/diheme cytochrome c family protein